MSGVSRSSASHFPRLPTTGLRYRIGLGLRDALYRAAQPSQIANHFRICKTLERGEQVMAVDGNWNLVMSTPMGERRATLSLKSAGGTLTGTQGADGNSTEIFDGTASGD